MQRRSRLKRYGAIIGAGALSVGSAAAGGVCAMGSTISEAGIGHKQASCFTGYGVGLSAAILGLGVAGYVLLERYKLKYLHAKARKDVELKKLTLARYADAVRRHYPSMTVEQSMFIARNDLESKYVEKYKKQYKKKALFAPEYIDVRSPYEKALDKKYAAKELKEKYKKKYPVLAKDITSKQAFKLRDIEHKKYAL